MGRSGEGIWVVVVINIIVVTRRTPSCRIVEIEGVDIGIAQRITATTNSTSYLWALDR